MLQARIRGSPSADIRSRKHPGVRHHADSTPRGAECKGTLLCTELDQHRAITRCPALQVQPRPFAMGLSRCRPDYRNTPEVMVCGARGGRPFAAWNPGGTGRPDRRVQWSICALGQRQGGHDRGRIAVDLAGMLSPARTRCRRAGTAWRRPADETRQVVSFRGTGAVDVPTAVVACGADEYVPSLREVLVAHPQLPAPKLLTKPGEVFLWPGAQMHFSPLSKL